MFCCPTTDQVPDGGTKDHSDHLLGDPLCDHVLFSSAIRLFLLVVLLLDFINMCCISLEGLKWAFAPTSKYKNKHRSGEIFPVFFFFWYCFVGWGDLHPVPGTCELSCDPLLLAPLHCY